MNDINAKEVFLIMGKKVEDLNDLLSSSFPGNANVGPIGDLADGERRRRLTIDPSDCSLGLAIICCVGLNQLVKSTHYDVRFN